MQCEKCRKNPGKPYSFYYGKKLAEKSEEISAPGAQYKIYKSTTNYRLGGEGRVFLCDKCLKPGVGAWLLFVVFILLTIGVFAAFGVLWGLGATALTIMVYVNSFTGDLKDRGIKKAIEIRRRLLTSEGFDTFWTPQEYQKLKISNTFRQ